MRSAGHLLVALALFGSLPAFAMEPEEDDEGPRVPRLEVTPFAGYHFGGDFDVEGSTRGADLDDHVSYALALDLRAEHDSQYELFYSRQASRLESTSPLGALDVDVEYLHIGGTLVVADKRIFAPYIVATAGATRFDPEGQGADEDTRFSLSLGAGIRVPLTPRFRLRLEARGYLTLMNGDTSVFCASAGGAVCAARTSGSTFFQYEILAGAALGF